MAIEGYSNNFILKAAENTKATNIQSANLQPIVNQSKNIELKDTFEKKGNNDNFVKKNLLPAVSYGIALAVMLFLSELLIRRKKNITPNLLESLRNYMPLIGDKFTSQSQKILKNGKMRINIDSDCGRFFYRETLVMDGAKIKQRVISKKEKMLDGTYLLREMKSYKGDNLVNNEELKKNEAKYLIKHFKRTDVGGHEASVKVQEGQKIKKYREHYSSLGQPILKISENDKHKENMAFLYSGEQCVGTDKQLISKSDASQYHILTLPKNGIFAHKYNPEVDGRQYDLSLMKKLLENF